MKNREKYKDEIIESCVNTTMCDNIRKPIVLPTFRLSCKELNCRDCSILLDIWLDEEYKEPETDWSKVAVDTPILVNDYQNEDREWIHGHFAKYDSGKIYTFSAGHTSWSGNETLTPWNYAKLAESEEAE